MPSRLSVEFYARGTRFYCALIFLSFCYYFPQLRLYLYEDDWNVAYNIMNNGALASLEDSYRPMVDGISWLIYHLRNEPAILHLISIFCFITLNLATFFLLTNAGVGQLRSAIVCSLFSAAPQFSSDRLQLISMVVAIHCALIFLSLGLALKHSSQARYPIETWRLSMLLMMAVFSSLFYEIALPPYLLAMIALTVWPLYRNQWGILGRKLAVRNVAVTLLFSGALLVFKLLQSHRFTGHVPPLDGKPTFIPERLYFGLSVIKRTTCALIAYVVEGPQITQFLSDTQPADPIIETVLLCVLTILVISVCFQISLRRILNLEFGIGQTRLLRFAGVGLIVFALSSCTGFLTYTVQVNLSGMGDRTLVVPELGLLLFGCCTLELAARRLCMAFTNPKQRNVLFAAICTSIYLATIYSHIYVLLFLTSLWEQTGRISHKLLTVLAPVLAKEGRANLVSDKPSWVLIDHLPVGIGPAPIFYIETDKPGPLSNALRVMTGNNTLYGFNISYFDRASRTSTGTLTSLYSNTDRGQGATLRLTFPLQVVDCQWAGEAISSLQSREIGTPAELAQYLEGRKPMTKPEPRLFFGVQVHVSGWRLVKFDN